MGEGARSRAVRVLLGFALFGAFWGAWGAALPAVQSRTGVGDATLGAVLLLIGVGALLSMRVTGLLLDRLGSWIVPIVVVAFAGSILAIESADSAASLGVALLALGALSGAFDVIVNSAAVGYESATGRPLVGLAHGTFSGAVVLASAVTGLARSAQVAPATLFLVVAILLGLSAVPMRGLIDGTGPSSPGKPPSPARPRRRVSTQLAALGALCALANIVESAHQSWSARHLESVLNAPAHLSALGPSLFALTTMAGRFAGQFLGRRFSARVTVASGGVLAAVGTLVVALATTVQLGLAGVAVAGLGTGVCVPMILSTAGAGVPPERRGASVGMVMTIAYVGFVAGPAFVGVAAGQFGLRAALAMVAVGAVLLAFAAAVTPSMRPRLAGMRTGSASPGLLDQTEAR